MSSYDSWKSTPDGDDWLDAADDERARRTDEGEPRSEPACFDCGDRAEMGFTSVPVDGGRRYCALCQHWRSVRGLLFDARHRDVLDREIA